MKLLVLLVALVAYIDNCTSCSCFPTHPQTEFCHAGYVIRFEVLNRSFVLRDYDYASGKSYVTRVLSDDLFKDNYRTRRSADESEDETSDVMMPLKTDETPPLPEIPSLTHAPDVPPIPDNVEPANDASTVVPEPPEELKLPKSPAVPDIPTEAVIPDEPEAPEVPEIPDVPELPSELPIGLGPELLELPPWEMEGDDGEPWEIPELPFPPATEAPVAPTTEDPYLWFRAEAMYTLGKIRIYKGEKLVKTLMGSGKTITGFSALDGARCGALLSVGETYYYMGTSYNNEIEFSACSFMMSKTEDLKDMTKLSNMKKNLVYNWPKACNSSCTIKTECYYYCPEIDENNANLVCDEEDLHKNFKDAWNMEAACMNYGDVCQWSVGSKILSVPKKFPKLVPVEKVPPSEGKLLTPPDENDKSLPVPPQVAILEIDTKSLKSGGLPVIDPDDDDDDVPPFFPDESTPPLPFSDDSAPPPSLVDEPVPPPIVTPDLPTTHDEPQKLLSATHEPPAP